MNNETRSSVPTPREMCPVPVRLSVPVTVSDDEPVYESTMLARFGSPRVVYDTVLPVENVVFRGPGEYYWQMCCGAEVLHEIRFIVLNDGEIG